MIRTITYNSVSTAALGITIADGSWGQPVPRIVQESVPYRDGTYDFSTVGGLHYDNRTLEYTINIIGSNDIEAAAKLSDVLAWLYSDGDGILSDDNLPGWYFREVRCTEVSYEFVGTARRAIRLTAKLTAAPKQRKAGSTIMTVAEFIPTANTVEYIWLYAGDKLYYNSISSTDLFDTKIISSDKKSITTTINVTDWDKGAVKVQVPSFIEQVSARIDDNNILTPSLMLNSLYYYTVGAGHHVLSLTFTAYSGVSISDSMAQYVTAVGFSSSIAANTSPSLGNLKISPTDSLPKVSINGMTADIDNISLSDDLTSMEISKAKDDKLRLVYNDTEDRL